MDGSDDRGDRQGLSSWMRTIIRPNDARGLQDEDRHPETRNRIERESNHDDRENRDRSPFVAFKDFVDGQIAAVMHLPANIAEIKRRTLQDEADLVRRELDLQLRWKGVHDLEDASAVDLDRLPLVQRIDAVELREQLLQQAEARVGAPVDKWVDLYRDPEQNDGAAEISGPNLSVGGACYYMSESRNYAPSSTSMYYTSAPQPRWLSVGWFKRSPYSPISLEADPDLARYDTKWRHAFEELLQASLGKPIHSEERFGGRPYHEKATEDIRYSHPVSTWRAPGLDWMFSLQCRGILPPQLPSFYQLDPWETVRLNTAEIAKDAQDLDREILTPALLEPHASELDMYQQQAFESVGAAIKEGIRQERQVEVGGCPDELGRAVAEAARDERESVSGGCPDDMGRALAELMKQSRESGKSACSDGLGREMAESARQGRGLEKNRCPDELGRLMGESARLSRALDTGSYRDEAQREQILDRMALFWYRQQELMSQVPEEYLPDEYIDADEFDEELDEEDDEEADDLPGELWSREQQLKRQHGQASQDQVSQHDDRPTLHPQNSKILSALTTTQTTRLPDGTVITKSVLKTRFADGREDTRESLHTSYEGAQEIPAAEAAKEEKEKKGWFWS